MAVAAPPEHEQPAELEMNAEPVDEAREYAIATLKRKRKFAQDLVAYVAVNGLLWLIWLFIGPLDQRQYPVARLGFARLGVLPRPRRLASLRQMARESEYADHGGRDRPRGRADGGR